VMGDATARFAREWNFALLLVALVAVYFLTDGHIVLSAVAGGLCMVAIIARWRAMRKQGRGFYGQQKQAR
jgi:hypothetical protein